jgi:enamine deaminase RidA (YjgF/YER057c/UK114 family)
MHCDHRLTTYAAIRKDVSQTRRAWFTDGPFSSTGQQRSEPMPKFKMFAPGPYGTKQAEQFSYSQVMEIDGRIELSGQGGWHPETLDYPPGISIETEIGRACDNVELMLGAVGLGWRHVAHVNSYHVPEPDGLILGAVEEMVRQFRIRIPGHKPIWTALGVAVLGDPGMRVEIRVTAFRD